MNEPISGLDYSLLQQERQKSFGSGTQFMRQPTKRPVTAKHPIVATVERLLATEGKQPMVNVRTNMELSAKLQRLTFLFNLDPTSSSTMPISRMKQESTTHLYHTVRICDLYLFPFAD